MTATRHGWRTMSRSNTVAARGRSNDDVNVLVDTPKGSRNKYKYDADAGCFRLSRILPVGASFPFDFGSIPQTCAADGDPLDVMVIGDAPTFPGCLLRVKLIGVISAEQKERRRLIRNDRLIGVPRTPVNRPQVRDIRELGADCLHDIEHFFVSYNRAQGRDFRILQRLGPRAAVRMVAAARRAFKQRNS